MPHPSNRSIKLSAGASADYATFAVVEAATMRAGETLISATATSYVDADDHVFVSVTPSGTAEAFPVPPTEFYFDGTALKFRRPLAYNATIAWGSALTGAEFVIPNGCNGVTVQNVDSASVYIRTGHPNAFGIPIGKPGDSNSDDVQGIELVAGGSFFLQSGQFAAGDKWYVLGTAGGEDVIVNFS